MRLHLILTAVSTAALLTACGAGDDRKDGSPPAVQIGATGALSQASIDAAVWRAPTPSPAPGPNAKPDTPPLPAQPTPMMIRAQILLDRLGYSPGVIAVWGARTQGRPCAPSPEPTTSRPGANSARRSFSC